MRKRTPLAWTALIANGMAWFGLAGFLLALAGAHITAVTTGPAPQAIGFALIVAVGITAAIAGVLDNRRIRTTAR